MPILDSLHSQLTVISVGAHNRYGNPVQTILSMLQAMLIPTFRTDKNGDIEIVSDGENGG